MRFLEDFHTFGTFVFQHNAWFNSGFLLIRQTTQALTGTGRTPWPCSSADHGDSTTAALERGDRCPCCFGHAGSLPRRGAEAVSHGQACLADHRDFAVAVRAWWSTFLLCGSSKCREACSGCAGRAGYTGTRPMLTPAIRAGKGWRGRRELAPRCSAIQLGASRGRIWTDTHVKHTVRTTTTTTTTHTHPPTH